MCVCVCVCMYVCMYVCIHIYIYIHTPHQHIWVCILTAAHALKVYASVFVLNMYVYMLKKHTYVLDA